MKTNLLVKGLLFSVVILFGGAKSAEAGQYIVVLTRVQNTSIQTVNGSMKSLIFQGLTPQGQSVGYSIPLNDAIIGSNNVECARFIERAHDTENKAYGLFITVDGPDSKANVLTNVRSCQLSK